MEKTCYEILILPDGNPVTAQDWLGQGENGLAITEPDIDDREAYVQYIFDREQACAQVFTIIHKVSNSPNQPKLCAFITDSTESSEEQPEPINYEIVVTTHRSRWRLFSFYI